MPIDQCTEGARILERTRAEKGPVSKIKVTKSGFEVTFDNGHTMLAAGMTFDTRTHSDQVAVQSVISRIMRDDWNWCDAQVEQFFDEQPRLPGMTIDRNTMGPQQHELRLA